MATMRRWVTETLLWVVSAAGLACIVLVVLAYSCNISIVLFRTGSMEPAISTGDVAIVQQVEAAEVQIGDILTVDRDGELPVTHRVISVTDGPSTEERVIRMRGDANEAEDPYPYTISEGKRTLFSLPGLAAPIHQMSNPYVLGGATLSAALLVLWAFWPRTPPPPTKRGSRTSPEAPAAPRETVPRSTSEPLEMSRRLQRETVSKRVRHRRRARLTTVLLVSSSLTFLPAHPLHATDLVREELQGTYLSLTSVYSNEARQNLGPDDGTVWDIRVESRAPTSGILDTRIAADGHVPLNISAATCSRPWSAAPGRLRATLDESLAQCAGEHRIVTKLDSIPADGSSLHLESRSLADPLWYRLVVSLPRDAAREHQNTEASVQLQMHAFDEELVLSPPTDHAEPGSASTPGKSPHSSLPQTPAELGATGTQVAATLLAALLLLCAGASLYRRSRRGGSATLTTKEVN